MRRDFLQRLERFIDWWTAGKVALLLLGIGLISGVAGYISQHPDGFVLREFLADYYANVSSEMVSIAITVLIIDTLDRRRDEKERRAREHAREQMKRQRYQSELIRQMGSKINRDARRAIEALRAEGWLENGSLDMVKLPNAQLEEADLRWARLKRAQLYRATLKGANLFGADLEGIHLAGADLTGAQMGRCNLYRAYLEGVNFTGARKLSHKNLSQASRLKGAIMPDGGRYNGCYNLQSDIRRIHEAGIELDDIEAVAEWYGVSAEAYVYGQEWASLHLDRLRQQAENDRLREERVEVD